MFYIWFNKRSQITIPEKIVQELSSENSIYSQFDLTENRQIFLEPVVTIPENQVKILYFHRSREEI